MTTYHARPRLAAARPAGRRRDDHVEDGRIAQVGEGAGGAGAEHLRRPGAAGPRQRALARVPPGAARAHPARRGRPRLVLDLARADVRRRRPARPGRLPRAGPGHLRRDGAGRHHLRRRVPLPAPRAGRAPLRRPERDGSRPGPGRPRGRAADRPCWTPATSPAASASRWTGCSTGSATATRTGGRRGPRHCTRRTPVPGTSWSARPCTRCGPCRPTSSAPSLLGPPTTRHRSHAHVSEQPAGERRVPAGLRRDADPAAARPRRARPAHDRGARDPPHRRRHRAARRHAARRCACARPPSGTWPTASDRPAACATPARR